MKSLIGTVTNPNLVARLFDDGNWEVDVLGLRDPGAALIFKSQYGSLGDGPQDGRPGALSLHRAAEDIGGTVEMTPDPPFDPSVVY